MEDPIRSCNPDRTILAELEMSMSICGFFEKHIPATFRRNFLAWAHREAHLTKAATKIFDFSRLDSRRLAAIPTHIERITSKPGNSESPDLRQLWAFGPEIANSHHVTYWIDWALNDIPLQLYQGREYRIWHLAGADTEQTPQCPISRLSIQRTSMTNLPEQFGFRQSLRDPTLHHCKEYMKISRI